MRNSNQTYEYFDTPLNKVVFPWLANNPGKLKNIKAREVNRKGESAKFDSVMFVIPSGDKFIQLDAKKDKDGTMIIEDPKKWKVGGCISVPYETNRKLSIGIENQCTWTGVC